MRLIDADDLSSRIHDPESLQQVFSAETIHVNDALDSALKRLSDIEKPAHVITAADFVNNPLMDFLFNIPAWCESLDGLPGWWCFINKATNLNNGHERLWNKKPRQSDIERVNANE